MDNPLVSVVMSNYNTNHEYLVQSITSILRQSYPHFEFIIIDDASTNGDMDLIRSFEDDRIVRVQNESNRGISYSVNRGLNMARGKYIARMDADDIAHEQRLARQVAYLEAHSEIDVLAARAQNFGVRKGLSACLETEPETIRTLLFFACVINHPSTMYRRAFVEEHNLRYNTDYNNAEDYHFWSQCVRKGTISEYPRVLLYYRRHDGQVSISDRQRQVRLANQVREAWLNELVISPTQPELWMHYGLCIGAFQHGDIPREHWFSLADLSDWCVRLCEANRVHAVFAQNIFERAIACRYMLVGIKAMRAGHTSLRQLLRHPFAKTHLHTASLPILLRHGMISAKLNQRFARPGKPPVY